MEVHRTLGPGFQEVIYQRALHEELIVNDISAMREVEQPIYYKGKQIGTRRADFVIEGKLVVEIKAVIGLQDVHIAQAKNYTVAYDFPLGLLINFGSKSLEYKLMYNQQYEGRVPEVL